MRRSGSQDGTRWSALWGKPSKGEARLSALWGKGGRGVVATLALAMALGAPAAALASGPDEGRYGRQLRAFVPEDLETAARAHPTQIFSVIVQSRGSTGSVAGEVDDAADATLTRRDALKRRFAAMGTVSARLTGAAILKLARVKSVLAITPDAPVVLTGLYSTEGWPLAANVARFWRSTAQAPTIAIVDSGIDAGRSDFGGRIVADVKLTQLPNNSPGDGRGHGTFVAGIAAGSAPGKAGAAPNANIVSIDVMDDSGMAMTSDVIAAAEWIYQHKSEYNIRVVNFSLHSSSPASVMWDPLDAAVEKLWFSGVVVVAAAGNYGRPDGPSGVPFAPGNDPFIITVGAVDIDGSPRRVNDDTAAPWSAYGYTMDGFAKPDLAAPGRYMVGPIPGSATLPKEKPQNMRGEGYMQLSGTSFAAPVIAGAAAQILAVHPDWTPDQVKGALMLTAKHLPEALPLSVGVGEVNAAAASDVLSPPNPNAALNEFVVSASGGSGKAFDSASWSNAARADASWASASWASASWSSASWASASWASASWSSASWASASWASASWASASWASSSTEDNAEGETPAPATETEASAADVHSAELEYGFDLDGDGLVGPPPTVETAPVAPVEAPLPLP